MFNVHGHGFQSAGWPDLQVYHWDWTGHIELKVGDGRVSTLQRICLRELNKRGTNAVVLRLKNGSVYFEKNDEIMSKMVWPVKSEVLIEGLLKISF